MTTESDPSILETWTENPGATAAAIGLGVLVGAGLTFAIVPLATGDEPPIRVRNGSIQLEVVHKTVTWKKVGNTGMRWKLSRGERDSDVYQLYLSPTVPADCTAMSPKGEVVRYILDDHTDAAPSWIQVDSTDKKTEVTSAKPLTLSQDEQTLSYGAGNNYVKEIVLDGTRQCAFTSKDPNLHAVMTE